MGSPDPGSRGRKLKVSKVYRESFIFSLKRLLAVWAPANKNLFARIPLAINELFAKGHPANKNFVQD